jgi:hypothetical protein
MRTIHAALLLVAVLACDTATTATPAPEPKPEATSLRSATAPSGPPTRPAANYCDLFPCEICPLGICPPGGLRVSYCCPNNGPCLSQHVVPDGTLCPEGTFLAICNWGVTNADGTWTCYDE